MAIIQPSLPYEINALEPHISAQTLSYHYDRHHRGYVDKLNGIIANTPLESMELEPIIELARKTTRVSGVAKMDILNNALQAWNHAFLWESMSPNGGGKPDGRLIELIKEQYGDFDTFARLFREEATGLFGSGWVWLVEDRGKLNIVTSGNADSPVCTQLNPLLVIDVWEHAYYLDYQNDRKRYVDTFLSHLVNWRFAASNLQEHEAPKAA